MLGPYAGWLFRGVLDRSGPTYLLILVFIGGMLALLNTAALLVFQRLLHKYALQVSVALRRAIHDQAFVLGPHELLTPVRSRAEELFVERVEAVRHGLVRWWDAMPRSVVEIVLLLLLALMLNFWLSLLVILLALYIAPVARGWQRQARRERLLTASRRRSCAASLLRRCGWLRWLSATRSNGLRGSGSMRRCSGTPRLGFGPSPPRRP